MGTRGTVIMDPQACLQRWVDAADSPDDALEAAEDYAAWVSKGGFKARLKTHPGHPLYAEGIQYATVQQLSYSIAHCVTDDGIKMYLTRQCIL